MMALAGRSNSGQPASDEVEVQVVIDRELRKYSISAAKCSALSVFEVKNMIAKQDPRLTNATVFARVLLGQTRKDLDQRENVGQALQSSSGQRKILLFLDEKLELERAVEFHQTGTVKVTPAPAFLPQDVQELSHVEKKCELIDNSLSAIAEAWADPNRPKDGEEPYIWVLFKDGDKLIIEDNGIGMSREVLEKCLVTSATHSALLLPPRTPYPLRLPQYVSLFFSRYGRGLNAVWGLGTHLTIESTPSGTNEGYKLEGDQAAWDAAYKQGQYDSTFQCSIVPVCSLQQANSRTTLTISNLHPKVREDLSDAAVRKWFAHQIYGQYVLINSDTEHHSNLWQKLPSLIRPQRDSRLGGRLKIKMKLFDCEDPTSSGGSDPHKVSQLINAAVDQRKKHPRLLPFALPLRFVPRGRNGVVYDNAEGTGGTANGTSGSARNTPRCPADPVLLDVDEQDLRNDPDEVMKRVCQAASSSLRYPSSPAGAAATTGRGTAGGRSSTPWQQHNGSNESARAGPSYTAPEAGGAAGRQKQQRKKAGSRAARGSGAEAELPRQGTPHAAGANDDDDDDEMVKEAKQYADNVKFRDPVADAAAPTFTDFLLVLLYYPVLADGQLTKPDPSLGVLPLWCGRLLPEDPLVHRLPPLVEAASVFGVQHERKPSARRLDGKRVGGLLFVSPDGKPVAHKTKLDGAAYKALTAMGERVARHGMAGGKNSSELEMPEVLQEGTMYTWDYASETYRPDKDGSFAAAMLYHFFQENWYPLDEMMRLEVDLDMSTEEVEYGTRLILPPNKGDPWRQGDLVTLVGKSSSNKQTDLGDAAGQVGGGQQQGNINPSQLAAQKHAVIESFCQTKGNERIEVNIKPWRPSWSTKSFPVQRRLLQDVRMIAEKEKERREGSDKLVKAWENSCPFTLMYLAARPNNDKLSVSLEATAAKDLQSHQGGVLHVGQVWDQLRLVLVDRNGKPLKGIATTKNFPVQKFTFVAEIYSRLQDEQEKLEWSQKFTPDAQGVVTVHGFKESVRTAGHYRITVSPEDTDGWMPEPRGPEDPPCVTYRFKVEKESGPYAIKAEWLQDGGQRHATKLSRLIRLGTPLPDILLKLYRGNQEVEWPIHPNEVLKATTIHLTIEGSAPASGAQQEGEEPADTDTVQSERDIRLVKNGTAAKENESVMLLHAVKLDKSVLWLNNKPCCYKADIQATFKVQLTEPGRPPAEVVTEAPLLFTFGSGLAASLRVPEKRLDVSKGGYLDQVEVDVYDRDGNPYYSPARDGAYAELRLQGIKDSKGMHAVRGGGKRGKGRGATAQEAEPVVKLPVKVSGSISIESGRFFVSGLMGGKAYLYLALGPDTKLPESTRKIETEIEVDITRHHFTFWHRLLKDAPGGSQSQKACQGAISAYLLDLIQLNHRLLSRLGKAPPPRLDPAVWPSRSRTHNRGANPIQDVLAGLEVRHEHQLLVRPSGTLYSGQSARQRLIHDFNSMLDPHIEEYVYEPLLVVEHGATSVGGIGLTMCLHTTDQEDPTFAAPVQVVVRHPQQSGSAYPEGQVVGAPSVGELGWSAKYQEEERFQLPDLPVGPGTLMHQAWLRGLHTVPCQVTDVACDGEEGNAQVKVYGTFHLRLAPYPAEMAYLPFSYSQAAPWAENPAAVLFHVRMCKPVVRAGESWVQETDRATARALEPPANSSLQGLANLAMACSTPTALEGANAEVAIRDLLKLAGQPWRATCAGQRTETFSFWHDQVVLATPLPIKGHSTVQVAFMLFDQLHCPIKATEYVKEELQSKMRARTTADAPGAGAGSGGRFGSGATKRGRGAAAGDADAGGSEAGQQKPEVEIVPDSWIWNLGCDGAEEGGSAEAGQALKQLPIHMVTLRVVSGLGKGALELSAQGIRPAEGATVSSNLSLNLPIEVVAGDLAPNGLGLRAPQTQSSVQVHMHQGLPPELDVTGAVAAAAGTVTTGRGSRAKRQRTAAAAEGSGDAGGGRLAAAPPDPAVAAAVAGVPPDARWCSVTAVDGQDVQLNLTLVDDCSNAVTAATELVLLPQPGWALQVATTKFNSRKPVILVPGSGAFYGHQASEAPGTAEISWPQHISLTFRLPRSAASVLTGKPQVLVLQPKDEGSPALPLAVHVTLSPGSYAVALYAWLPRTEWKEHGNVSHRIEDVPVNVGARVVESPEELFAAGGRILESEYLVDLSSSAQAPVLPTCRIVAVTPGGEVADQLNGNLQLHWERETGRRVDPETGTEGVTYTRTLPFNTHIRPFPLREEANIRKAAADAANMLQAAEQACRDGAADGQHRLQEAQAALESAQQAAADLRARHKDELSAPAEVKQQQERGEEYVEQLAWDANLSAAGTSDGQQHQAGGAKHALLKGIQLPTYAGVWFAVISCPDDPGVLPCRLGPFNITTAAPHSLVVNPRLPLPPSQLKRLLSKPETIDLTAGQQVLERTQLEPPSSSPGSSSSPALFLPSLQGSLSDKWGNCLYLPDTSVMSLVLQQVPQHPAQQLQQRTHRRAAAGTSAGGMGQHGMAGQDEMDWQAGGQVQERPKEWVLMQLRPKRLLEIKADKSQAAMWQPEVRAAEAPPLSQQEGQEPPSQEPPRLSDRAGNIMFPPIALHDIEPLAKASADAVHALLAAGVGADLHGSGGADVAAGFSQGPVLVEGHTYRFLVRASIPTGHMHAALSKLDYEMSQGQAAKETCTRAHLMLASDEDQDRPACEVMSCFTHGSHVPPPYSPVHAAHHALGQWVPHLTITSEQDPAADHVDMALRYYEQAKKAVAAAPSQLMGTVGEGILTAGGGTVATAAAQALAKETWALGPGWVLEREVWSLKVVPGGAQEKEVKRGELERQEASHRRKLEELATEAQRQQAALAAVAQRLELVSGQLMELMGRQPTPQEVERFKEAKTRDLGVRAAGVALRLAREDNPGEDAGPEDENRQLAAVPLTQPLRAPGRGALLFWPPDVRHPMLAHAPEILAGLDALLEAGVYGKVYGPLGMLFACEREDVAAALLPLVKMDRWICHDEASRELLGQRVRAHPVLHTVGAEYLVLERREYLGSVRHKGSFVHQRADGFLEVPEPQEGVRQLLQEEEDTPGRHGFRFVGYACNLVHLPRAYANHVLRFRVNQQEFTATLRQVVAWKTFLQIMVFETRECAQRFAGLLRARSGEGLARGTRIMSLDGYRTNFDVGVDVEAAASAAQSTNNARRLSTLPKEYLLTHPCMDPRVLPAKDCAEKADKWMEAHNALQEERDRQAQATLHIAGQRSIAENNLQVVQDALREVRTQLDHIHRMRGGTPHGTPAAGLLGQTTGATTAAAAVSRRAPAAEERPAQRPRHG